MSSVQAIDVEGLLDLGYAVVFDTELWKRGLPLKWSKPVFQAFGLEILEILWRHFVAQGVHETLDNRAAAAALRYGPASIANQLVAFLKEPLESLKITGKGWIGEVGAVVQMFNNHDALRLGTVFFRHGVYEASMQRMWCMLRSNLADTEHQVALHQALMSLAP